MSTSVSHSSDRFTGRVKWFNNKAGYGFITVTDGSRSGTDVFVHHSSIKVDSDQYKYLVQGEYVEFGLLETTNGDHEVQSSDVSGIKGGKLMCETRRELRTSRSQYNVTKNSEVVESSHVDDVKLPTSNRVPRNHQRETQKDHEDWTPVTTSKSKKSSKEDESTSVKRTYTKKNNST
jgi:CspA family cold shock protein